METPGPNILGCGAGLLRSVREAEEDGGLDADGGVDEFMEAEAREAEAASISTEFVIRMLGLGICGNTEVGNALRPACSPGQKKRVTTGGSQTLMLYTPHSVCLEGGIVVLLPCPETLVLSKQPPLPPFPQKKPAEYHPL